MPALSIEFYIKQFSVVFPFRVLLAKPSNYEESNIWCLQNCENSDWDIVVGPESATMLFFKHRDDAIRFKLLGY